MVFGWSDKNGSDKTGEYGQNGNWIYSTCGMCLHGCGIKVKVVDGVAVKIEGDESNLDNLGKLCPKGNAGLNRLYDPNRIKKPLKRTNPKKGIDEDPGWVEIEWDEAYEIVAEKLKKVREDDPRKLLGAIGDFQRIEFWGWPAAFGSPNYFSSIGNYCGGSYHPVNGSIDGAFAAINDYDYCEYWIQLGGGDGFSSHLHVAGSSKRMADRRMDGMKLVVADPRCSRAAAKADEWLPVRPGTDRAFVLGMAHVLVHELNRYDREFLRSHTNAPYLVKDDGHLLRIDGEAQVWDKKQNRIRPWNEVDDENIALEGRYSTEGLEEEVRTGFQVWKDILEGHTPENMSEICGISVESIRRIAREFVEAARIGETIELDGKTYPFRPAALNYYRGAQSHDSGLMDNLTYKLFNMLVGNLDVPGGHLGVPLDERGFFISEGDDGMIKPEPHQLHPAPPFKENPDSTQLLEWFPIGFDAGQLNAQTILNPEKFGLDYKPEALVMEHCNPVWNLPETDKIEQIMKDLDFIVAIDIQHTESTQYADVILPEHTYLESTLINCLEPPVVTGYSVRQPVVEPLYDTRDAYDIFTELAERVGFLDDWNDLLNMTSGFVNNTKYLLDPETRYTCEEYWDRRCKAIYGDDKGLDWFKENGHAVRRRTPEEQYMPYGNLRIPFYVNYFKEIGDEMAENMKNTPLPDWPTDNYQPLPFWRAPELDRVDAEEGYDLYAISFKTVMHTFGDTLELPWLSEVSQRDPMHAGILINSETAETMGLEGGDTVRVTSMAGSITGVLQPSEAIHPEVIGVSNCITRSYVTNSNVDKSMRGSHFNRLLHGSIDYTDNASGGMETVARVKVEKLQSASREEALTGAGVGQ